MNKPHWSLTKCNRKLLNDQNEFKIWGRRGSELFGSVPEIWITNIIRSRWAQIDPRTICIRMDRFAVTLTHFFVNLMDQLDCLCIVSSAKVGRSATAQAVRRLVAGDSQLSQFIAAHLPACTTCIRIRNLLLSLCTVNREAHSIHFKYSDSNSRFHKLPRCRPSGREPTCSL